MFYWFNHFREDTEADKVCKPEAAGPINTKYKWSLCIFESNQQQINAALSKLDAAASREDEEDESSGAESRNMTWVFWLWVQREADDNVVARPRYFNLLNEPQQHKEREK